MWLNSLRRDCVNSGVFTEGHYTGRYVFTDLNGENKQPVDFGEGNFWPVIYLAHLDAIVLQ